MSASVMRNLGRAPEGTPDVQQAAARENDARQTAATTGGVTAASVPSISSSNGAGSIRTGLQIVPSPNEAAAALKSSATQIARLQSNPQEPTARAASEAYQTQAAARPQIASQGQAGVSRSINLTA